MTHRGDAIANLHAMCDALAARIDAHERRLENYPIQSSCIARLEYDPDPGEASYRFWKGGGSYVTPMPHHEVDRWANAKSVGRYFNRHVRGKY